MAILIDDKVAPSWGGTTEFLDSGLATNVIKHYARKQNNWRTAPKGKKSCAVFVDFDDTLALNTASGVDNFVDDSSVKANVELICVLDFFHADRWFVLTARGMCSNANQPIQLWEERAQVIRKEIRKFLEKHSQNKSEPLVGIKAYNSLYTDEYVATPKQVVKFKNVWLVARANNTWRMKLAWQLYRLGLIICP